MKTRTQTTVWLGLVAIVGCQGRDGDANETGDNTGISMTVSGSETTAGSGESDPTLDAGETMFSTDVDTGVDTTGMNCGEVDYQLAAVPPNVVLVLDKSGSMVSDNDSDADGVWDGYWDHDADPDTDVVSRWNSLFNVVEFVVGTFDVQINFGAILFPSQDATDSYSANACLVEDTPEIPVASQNGAAILAAIPDALAIDLYGATPATAGIEAAIAHLETLDPAVPRFLILVTDGAANCSSDYPAPPDLLEAYDVNLPQVVGDAYTQRDIPTFVVGIDIVDELSGVGADGAPEANTFVELNTVAEAGGRPRPGAEKFFNTVNEIELMDALGEIAGEVITCVIELSEPPVHQDFVEVEVNGVSYMRVEDCATEDGWVYVNPDGPYDAVQLCGAACDGLAEAGTADITYGCPPAG